MKNSLGQTLVELLIAIGLSAIILPALAVGFMSSRDGRAQEKQRADAIALFAETMEAVRSVREKGWTTFAVDGTYHPIISGNTWTFASGAQTVGNYTREVVVSSVERDANGVVVESGGTVDPSTKKVVITVSWDEPNESDMSATMYFTRYLDNLSYIHTTFAEFNSGTKTQVAVTTVSNGEVQISDNNKAKWCAPEFASSTIDLPDGPPVAVSAKANVSSTAVPNEVFVATSPNATNSAKLAHVRVSANTDPPVSTLRGKFTLNASDYSDGGLVPSGTGFTNSFKTNDVAYYTVGNNTYALLATDMPNKEIIAVLVDDNNSSNDTTNGGEFQDPVNKIYKYKTFFNTRRYQGNNQSTPNQDQTPFGYGANSVAVLGNRGYATSGGYLYVFDLSNIDSKNANSGLDMVGCRIQLDGYDCQPGNGTDRKYDAGQTGTSWSDTTTPAHLDCSDGGNVEIFADNDIYPIQVSGNTYVYVAVGAGTNPEFNIVNATTAPTSGSALTGSSCGRISGGSSSWRRIGSYDFNSNSGTEEAANSVFAKSDGTRAYISSNGTSDSKQFYILNTTNKSSPSFLSGSSSSGPSSGFYQGTGANGEMYPRRSMTVLNGQRVVLVGKDGVSNGNDAQEYQVLNSSNEATPTYCSGINFDQGFNDLTSVIEADLDTYVYMVANTDLNELKIIQGGPDGKYFDAGTIESPTFDVGYSTAFNNFTANVTTPANTSIGWQFGIADPVGGSCSGVTFSFAGPDGTSNSYYAATGSAILLNDDGSGYENPGRCMRYKGFLSTTDLNSTPVVQDILINYSP